MQRTLPLLALGILSVFFIACSTTVNPSEDRRLGGTIDYFQFQQMVSTGEFDHLQNSESICFFSRALFPSGVSSYPGIKNEELKYLTPTNTITVKVDGAIVKSDTGEYKIESQIDVKSLEERMRKFNQKNIIKIKEEHIKSAHTTPAIAPR